MVRQAHHERLRPIIPSLSRDKPLDFLAQVTQHIPDRSQHLIRYYGWYSNKARGVRRKVATANAPIAQASAIVEPDKAEAAEFRKAARRRWAQLIKKVYEVDP